MTRYIDEDKMKADIKEVADITDGKLTEFEVLGILSGQPTADAVEVVRCKDCKRWFTGSGIDHDKYGAECVVMKRRMMPTNFCSYGEREEE